MSSNLPSGASYVYKEEVEHFQGDFLKKML